MPARLSQRYTPDHIVVREDWAGVYEEVNGSLDDDAVAIQRAVLGMPQRGISPMHVNDRIVLWGCAVGTAALIVMTLAGQIARAAS